MSDSATLARLDERVKSTDKRVDNLENKIDRILFFQMATLVSILLTLLALVIK